MTKTNCAQDIAMIAAEEPHAPEKALWSGDAPPLPSFASLGLTMLVPNRPFLLTG